MFMKKCILLHTFRINTQEIFSCQQPSGDIRESQFHFVSCRVVWKLSERGQRAQPRFKESANFTLAKKVNIIKGLIQPLVACHSWSFSASLWQPSMPRPQQPFALPWPSAVGNPWQPELQLRGIRSVLGPTPHVSVTKLILKSTWSCVKLLGKSAWSHCHLQPGVSQKTT